MSDLISRSALLKELDEVMAQYNWKDDGVIMDTLTCVRDMVSDTPTAYDVDKVVEQLEELRLKNEIKGASLFCEEDFCVNNLKKLQKHWHDAIVYAYNKAIEIVKAGGKSE